jgi:hypothetical protein
MFTNEFREKLRIGKYTKWASDFSEDNVHALVMMVGELGSRSLLLIEILEKFNAQQPYGGTARAIAAMRAIQDMVDGQRLTSEQAHQRIVGAVAKQMEQRRGE